MGKYFVTGNEYISLPTINTANGGVEGITFLHMGAKGLIHITGDEKTPLLLPKVVVDGQKVPLTNLRWSRADYWIPHFIAQAGPVEVSGCLLAPLGERGFVYQLHVKSKQAATVTYGLEGYFGETLVEINEAKPIRGEKCAYSSGWNHAFVMDLRVGLPLFALAPLFEPQVEWEYGTDEYNNIAFDLQKTVQLEADEEDSTEFYWGIGYEEVAATTSAKEMSRQGFSVEYEKTSQWLSARIIQEGEGHLRELLNLNLFFNFFFATGITLDTEEFCCVTSRSPRYYVSAAYWDRDSLLWSFPSILMVDQAYAREILTYVFTKQIRNVGIHSRYIDGTVLEPGFELDELCAPIIALKRYVDVSGDRTILEEHYIRKGVDRILTILKSKKHPTIHLYETFLQPTDDLHVYKYLTYDNVLVWRMLIDLCELFALDLQSEAEAVKEAIFTHCIKEHAGKPVFAWSVDLLGNWDIYDEPPGSLMLLPWYGFCTYENQVYQNTVEMIRDPSYRFSFSGKPIAEIGCEHAPHPWVLSICNSLLSSNREKALLHLSRTNLDNGIACESVHEKSGDCMTGAAFATCAGFLAFALAEALRKERTRGNEE
ncbi:MAG: glycoside hydrolase family 125 protein [Firmicutes bacterium]|nr:glycoside hydrolase family 125 protein [Bacillota bacterium]